MSAVQLFFLLGVFFRKQISRFINLRSGFCRLPDFVFQMNDTCLTFNFYFSRRPQQLPRSRVLQIFSRFHRTTALIYASVHR
jgi:hypothetical protein